MWIVGLHNCILAFTNVYVISAFMCINNNGDMAVICHIYWVHYFCNIFIKIYIFSFVTCHCCCNTLCYLDTMFTVIFMLYLLAILQRYSRSISANERPIWTTRIFYFARNRLLLERVIQFRFMIKVKCYVASFDLTK